jgi:hypothetical protein
MFLEIDSPTDGVYCNCNGKAESYVSDHVP